MIHRRFSVPGCQIVRRLRRLPAVLNREMIGDSLAAWDLVFFLRPSHVLAGAGVDLEGLAFFNEKRDVNRLSGL
jgi:hypothetical protein